MGHLRFSKYISPLKTWFCEVAIHEYELNWSANKGKTQVAPFILFVKGVAATGLYRFESFAAASEQLMTYQEDNE